MRRLHFEKLRPVCPTCRQPGDAVEFPLSLAAVFREQNDVVLEGNLLCTNSMCQREFPIIDGIPLIISGLRDYVANNVLPILSRSDLHPTTESILNDCLGPSSAWDALRYQVSCYAWDHYGGHDPEEARTAHTPGASFAVLRRGLELCGSVPRGPRLDIGCSVGGMTFALAKQTDELILGVDVNFGMLRVAQQVLQTGQVTYPRRRIGSVFDRRQFAVPLENADHIDFWACDASCLPLPKSSVGFVTALNVLDCVASPVEFIASIESVLSNSGKLIVATPYDWSSSSTPFEAWIGGHSQRSADAGAGEPILRRLLTPGAHPQSLKQLERIAEVDLIPWMVRLHDRSAMSYLVHMLVAEKRLL